MPAEAVWPVDRLVDFASSFHVTTMGDPLRLINRDWTLPRTYCLLYTPQIACTTAQRRYLLFRPEEAP